MYRLICWVLAPNSSNPSLVLRRLAARRPPDLSPLRLLHRLATRRLPSPFRLAASIRPHEEIKREGIPFSAKPMTCRLRRRRSCPGGCWGSIWRRRSSGFSSSSSSSTSSSSRPRRAAAEVNGVGKTKTCPVLEHPGAMWFAGHLRRAHRPRLQGRSLLWKIGSWYLDLCYPHTSSRTPARVLRVCAVAADFSLVQSSTAGLCSGAVDFNLLVSSDKTENIACFLAFKKAIKQKKKKKKKKKNEKKEKEKEKKREEE